MTPTTQARTVLEESDARTGGATGLSCADRSGGQGAALTKVSNKDSPGGSVQNNKFICIKGFTLTVHMHTPTQLLATHRGISF